MRRVQGKKTFVIQEPQRCGLPYCSVFHFRLLSLNILFPSVLRNVPSPGDSDVWLLFFKPCNSGSEVEGTVKEQERGDTVTSLGDGH